jgi:hypothetical protein
MGNATDIGTGVIERYLKCLADHDWDGLATTIADEGLVREGPFCDVVEGKEHYARFSPNSRVIGSRCSASRTWTPECHTWS